jgi:hypothetical protein
MACHTKWQETHQSLEIHIGSFLQDRISNSKPQAFCICGTTCCLNNTALLHTLGSLFQGQVLMDEILKNDNYEKCMYQISLWEKRTFRVVLIYLHNFLKLVPMSIQLTTGNYTKFMSQHLLRGYLQSNIHNIWILTHIVVFRLHTTFNTSLCVHFEQDCMHSL